MTVANQSTALDPVELAQNLIRFDTTSPPGNESECIAYINTLLSDAGFETTFLAKDPSRPNLIARLQGKGNAPPLLLYGHVDVVTTAHQQWTYPPFAGKIVDGVLWGRGALDMKSGVAMMLWAFLQAKSTGLVPEGDIIFAALSDEEAGGTYGANYLVEHHPEQFANVRYAIGEFGGFAFYVDKQKFYPIQMAEKQSCQLRMTVRGPGGHGSIPMRGGAMAQLGQLLQKLDKHRLPIHITPVVRQMIEDMAQVLPFPTSFILRQLLQPSRTRSALKVMGERGRAFEPLLCNTANATIVHGGSTANVIPSEIVLQVDGRLLPGYQPTDLINELQQIAGADVEIEVIHHIPGPAEPDMGLFDSLAVLLKESDPTSVPVPMMLPAGTDARFFSQLGIQTYGFLPMNLPPDLNFSETIHAADERIPIEAIRFGADRIYDLLQQYG